MTKIAATPQRLKPHLRSLTSYMCTVPNIMDYFRVAIYFAAVHGHFTYGIWWVMPVAIM